MKKKTAILVVLSLLLAIALFTYSFYEIFSLKNELQSLKNKPEEKQEEQVEDSKGSSIFEEQFQDYKSGVDSKLEDLEKRADTTNSTFGKIRNAVFSYIARDADVVNLRQDILNILNIF